MKNPMKYQADFILHTNHSPGAMVVTAAQFKSIPKAKHYARAMSNVLRAAQHLFEVEAKAMLLGAKGEANLVKARSRLQLTTSRLIVSGLDGKLKNTGEVPSKDLEPKWLTEARPKVSEASPEVVDCACRLISGVVSDIEARASGIEARATLGVIYQNDGNPQSDQSHIQVTWKDSDLVWVVSSANRPWPKVSVRLYEPNEPTKTIYLANEVVRQSIALLVRGY